MSQRIFLSYSHADRELAKRVRKNLGDLLKTEQKGLVVFDERRVVGPGDDIRKTLKGAMDRASLVVFLVTPESVKSQWVNYETGLAAALGKPAVVLGSKAACKSPFFPNLLKDVQFIELSDSLKA